jgi:flavorubredoxin
MAQLKVAAIMKDLQEKGVDSAAIEKVKNTLENMKPETIDKAVLFLGWATLILALGSIVLAVLGKTVADALWGALGAGIGGLAGIFMSK